MSEQIKRYEPIDDIEDGGREISEMVEREDGTYCLFADLEAAVAAERTRCRRDEVDPVKSALNAVLTDLHDLAVWYTNISAVEKIQKELK